MKKTLAHDILFGTAVADALGVPVEFKEFYEISVKQVNSNYAEEPKRNEGFGTWNKPVGTFSDDTSMMLCTAAFLSGDDMDLNHLMDLFVKWFRNGYLTADGDCFDIGLCTLKALTTYEHTKNWKQAGQHTERDNGNGSLMRILILLPALYNATAEERKLFVFNVSSCTHAHAISCYACLFYIELALLLAQGIPPLHAFEQVKKQLSELPKDVAAFRNLYSEDFLQTHNLDFNAGGYVVGSLEIAVHTLLRTNCYKDAVLEAIALGGDTDTNAAITGGLAAINYGYQQIPQLWMQPLKRFTDIENLAEQLHKKYL